AMSEAASKTACVCDDGQFVELAIRLSREFSKVYYWNPGLFSGFPKASLAAIGNGFDEIEWVRDFRSVKDKVDLFVFPAEGNARLQIELQEEGKRVIGSRAAESLEMCRINFKQVQERLGLNVPKHVIIHGLTDLIDHLKTVEDRWVKIDRYRGTFETQHHINFKLSQGWLRKLACDLGPLADEMSFLVEEPICGAVEIGYDGFFFGNFPIHTLFGPEIKSKCYIGAVVDYDDLDE